MPGVAFEGITRRAERVMCPGCDRGRSDWDMGHMFTGGSFS